MFSPSYYPHPRHPASRHPSEYPYVLVHEPAHPFFFSSGNQHSALVHAQHHPELSARDKYVAALVQAKAAKEEYFAHQAIEEEERVLRRRLEELQQRRTSSSRHGESDRLARLRLQVLEEERQAARLEEARQTAPRHEETSVRQHHRRAHEQRRQEQACLNFLQSRAREAKPTERHVRFDDHVQHRTGPPQTARAPTSAPDLVRNLGFRSVPPAHPQHLRKSVRAPRGKSTVAIEHALKVIFGEHVSVTHLAPKLTLKAAAALSPEPVPVKAESQGSRSTVPQADVAAGLELLLKGIVGGAVNVHTAAAKPSPSASPSVSQQKPSVLQKERPISPISSLKEQLALRAQSDEAAEVRDTAHAIFNSLRDVTSGPAAPASSASTSTTPTVSLSKGKAKADLETAPASETSHDLQLSLAMVDSIEIAYRKLVEEFVFPLKLDFTPTSSPASSDTEQSLTTRLAYTATNAPVRYYEQSLSGLLSQLDSVESYGHEELRARRKVVVGLVEGAIEELEREVEGRWRVTARKLQTAAAVKPYEVEESVTTAALEPHTGPAPLEEFPAFIQPEEPVVASTFAESRVSGHPTTTKSELASTALLDVPQLSSNRPRSPETGATVSDEAVEDDRSPLSSSHELKDDLSESVHVETAMPKNAVVSLTYEAETASLSPVVTSISLRVPASPVVSANDEGSDWSEVEA